MNPLTADRFAEFFRATTLAVAERELAEQLTREPDYKPDEPPKPKSPFPWQGRVAERVCAPGGEWPRAIALPTAAGKTGCIDIAVFALACQAGAAGRTAPRRIFFVVDRRVVVDQAYEHAKKLAAVLDRATDGILRAAADVLLDIGNPGWRELAAGERSRLLKERHKILDECDPVRRAKLWDKVPPADLPWVEARPLDVYALRGGMYREDTWVRSPLQPTVVTSTVDQVGSRLLFRGYGVSDSMKPVHAGLVGSDSLILLDEAHCSMPFAETAGAVGRYRGWNDALAPFKFVQMTATPAGDVPEAEIERDRDDDRNHPFLGKRINASKPAKLVTTGKIKGKNWRGPLVKKLTEEARGLMGQTKNEKDEVRAVGVIVNRVATARAVRDALASEDADVILLTGRMRPLDRDRILDRLRPLFTASKVPLDRRTYVVATQCLEVGADLDFHGLVTECASLDALRQRFGRLNRHAQARAFAPGVVVVRADQTEDTSDDPVYGASLANTWKWLRGDPARDEFDFGVKAVRGATEGVDLNPLNAPTDRAPVLLPAHLDCWVQTAPRPAPDPDPAIFLHGPTKPGVPDVKVVFRSDLGPDPKKWTEVVALCPPSSSEALPVRIDVFKKWLAGDDPLPDDLADTEGGDRDDDEADPPARDALRWGGPEDSGLVRDERDGRVRPNATYVIPTTADRTDLLGDFPDEAMIGGVPVDYAEPAFQRSRDRVVLRLPSLDLNREDDDFEEKLSDAVAVQAAESSPDWQRRAAEELDRPKRRTVAAYPEPLKGFVVTGKRRLHQYDPTFADDESSANVERRVSLEDHTRDVVGFARRFATGCGLSADLIRAFETAAWWHDLGKADPRFQAMLYGDCSPRTAARRGLLGKSGWAGGSPRERELARQVHRYPSGARHEMLSVQFLEGQADDLVLHLTASHHGECRPFAPPVADETIGEVRDLLREPVALLGQTFNWPANPGDAATVNAAVPERFWRVVRAHGWWGSAYLEAVFRLADHAASRSEQEETWQSPAAGDLPPALVVTPAPRQLRDIPLPGLDGSNPLAFLAAVGTLRLTDQLWPGQVRMKWLRLGRWVPVLEVPPEVTDDELIAALHEIVHREADPSAEKIANSRHKVYRGKLKAVERARKQVSDRKLRGAERDTAMAAEVEPLRQEADQARVDWLVALGAVAPAPFLSLGKALSVTADEFRTFAARVADCLSDGTPVDRQDADFAAAFGCDGCFDRVTGRIIPTEFQLITGSGHQFFLETLGSLMGCITREQLARSVFEYPWPGQDPRLSFRWNPADDRRYAYGWDDPSDEAVQTEHGANLLAAFGLPLFPVVPTARGAATTGFAPRSDPPTFTWPIWTYPVSADGARSLLAAAGLHATTTDRAGLSRFGVADAYRVRKIEVGRPPLSKLNLTAAVTV